MAISPYILFPNRARAKIAAPVGAADTSITVETGKGALFTNNGQIDLTLGYIEVFLISGTAFEIAGIWQDETHTGDTFYLERGYYNTTPLNLAAGDEILCSLSGNFLKEIVTTLLNQPKGLTFNRLDVTEFYPANVPNNVGFLPVSVGTETGTGETASVFSFTQNPETFGAKVTQSNWYTYLRAHVRIVLAGNTSGVRMVRLYRLYSNSVMIIDAQIIVPGANYGGKQIIDIFTPVIQFGVGSGGGYDAGAAWKIEIYQNSGAELAVISGFFQIEVLGPGV